MQGWRQNSSRKRCLSMPSHHSQSHDRRMTLVHFLEITEQNICPFLNVPISPTRNGSGRLNIIMSSSSHPAKSMNRRHVIINPPPTTVLHQPPTVHSTSVSSFLNTQGFDCSKSWLSITSLERPRTVSSLSSQSCPWAAGIVSITI